MKEETLKGADGVSIFIRSWQPAGSSRAIVAMVPGFNSHSGYFKWVGEQFAANGLAAYAVDLRGRGESEGERFYINNISEYISDVDLMVQTAKSRQPGLPLFLLGHSAGGVISCVYTLEHQEELTGLICESFAFQVPAPDIALAAFKGLSHLAPHAHLFKLNNEHFSRDPEVVEAMNNDPLIANESQSVEMVAEMVRADERLKREFPLIKLPVFIIHGTSDNVTKYEGSQFFYDTVGSKDKTLGLYEGHYHDLLNDLGKERVINDIQDWLDARIPARREAVATTSAGQG
jgi:alpha-beta hydrolase superfamily lysophospholipase